MNKKIFLALWLMLLPMLCFQSKAQDDLTPIPLDINKKQEVVDSVVARYTPWDEISMSGKLSSSLFPISPSVKIYMERGKLIVISVSAMLIGEVARIEIDPQEALAVNCYSNTYTVLPTSHLESICPGGLNVVQNLLLGRISVIGEGELSQSLASDVDLYSVGYNSLLLVPQQDIENANYNYFYMVSPETYLMQLAGVLLGDGDREIEALYDWGKKNVTIDMNASLGAHYIEASLKLDYPDNKTKKLDRIKLGSAYREVDIRNLLKF